MKFRIIHRAETASTNLDAREGAPGDVFTADYQTAGRGRLDHRWEAAPGENLLMSVVLDVAGLEAAQIATLPLVAGLAVAKAVSATAPARIKWPNDVYVEARKIAGILCELQGTHAIVGLGVNVRQQVFPAELEAKATSYARLGASASVLQVRDAVLEELSAAYERWRREGFGAVWPELAERDFLKGRQVRVFRTDDDAHPLVGRCGGIAADGAVLVDGHAVYSGEVRW